MKKDSYEENSLSFNVVIGESRTLETTYLKSYTKVGVVAIMWKTPDGRFVSRHLINAFEEFGRTSIPVTARHKLHHDFQPGNYTITYVLENMAPYPKFKIITVSSC